MSANRAWINAFNGKALIPSQNDGVWGRFDSRMFRYALADAYYNNTVYTNLISYAADHKFKAGLYKHTRGIYNPTKRLVDMHVAKVYGGTLDLKNMSGGAIPIVTDDTLIKDALKQLWKWSNWATQKSLFVRYGAMYGDAPLWIVDDRQAQKVRMEVIHPSRIKQAEFDPRGNVTRVIFEYEEAEEQPLRGGRLGEQPRVETFVKTVIVDKERYRTFKDGEPFAYYSDAEGNPIPEWDNEYGFVPLVIAKHTDMGVQWGANAINGELRKIDEINDEASLLNDQVRKTVRVAWYFAGVGKKTEIGDPSSERISDKDEITAYYGPAESQPHPMVAPLAIESALANIQSMIAELEKDMPELSLYRLRDGGNLTAPVVTAAYSDAIDRINEARGNYDDALVRAQMMALTIGGIGRYDGFESFSLQSYEQGDLEHSINERPVIEDVLSKEAKIDKLIQTSAPVTAVWSELGYSDDVIRQWVADKVAGQVITIEAQQAQNPQLTDGSENADPNAAAANDGSTQQNSNGSNAIRGNRLPSDQARQVNPINDDELASIAALHRRVRVGGN